jgi:charged multivesicular body protein 2A
MNLPQISKILQDFERESSAMDMREEMMSDTVDEVMEDEGETEEEESDKILKQVLDEIGVSVSQQVSSFTLYVCTQLISMQNPAWRDSNRVGSADSSS